MGRMKLIVQFSKMNKQKKTYVPTFRGVSGYERSKGRRGPWKPILSDGDENTDAEESFIAS